MRQSSFCEVAHLDPELLRVDAQRNFEIYNEYESLC
jgi:hypothetical protein